MRSLCLAVSLAVVSFAAAAAPALANTTSTGYASPLAVRTWTTLVADMPSPAGMQERSRHSDIDDDEAAPDDADTGDQPESDDQDGGTFAGGGPDFGPPDSDDGPDERGYRGGPDSSADGDGPHDGYADGDHEGQPDEDDGDTDDDSDTHLA